MNKSPHYLRATNRRRHVNRTELQLAEAWLARQEARLRITIKGRDGIAGQYLDPTATDYLHEDLKSVLALRALVTRLIQIDGLSSVDEVTLP